MPEARLRKTRASLPADYQHPTPRKPDPLAAWRAKDIVVVTRWSNGWSNWYEPLCRVWNDVDRGEH